LKGWKEDKKVIEFLSNIREEKCRQVFNENEIDFDTLFLLSDENLVDIGIKRSSRLKILEEIIHLKSKQGREAILFEDDDGDESEDIDDDTNEILDLLSADRTKTVNLGLRRVRKLANDGVILKFSIIDKLLDVLTNGSSYPNLFKLQKETLGIIYLIAQVDKNRLYLEEAGAVAVLAQILNVAADERESKTALLTISTFSELIKNARLLRIVRETPGIVNSLLKTVEVNIPDLQEKALNLLYILAVNNDMIQERIYLGKGLQILRTLLDNDNPVVRGAAANCIGGVAASEVESHTKSGNQFILNLATADLIRRLCALLRSDDAYIQQGCAVALAHLSDNYPRHKDTILKCGGVSTLVHLLSSASPEVQQSASRAIRCLARLVTPSILSTFTMKNVRTGLRKCGAVLSLASLLHSGRLSVREHALGALCELSKADDTQLSDQIWQAVGAGSLVTALESDSVNVQYYALGMIYYLTERHPTRREAVLGAGALEPIRHLEASQNADVFEGADWTSKVLQGTPYRKRFHLFNYSGWNAK